MNLKRSYHISNVPLPSVVVGANLLFKDESCAENAQIMNKPISCLGDLPAEFLNKVHNIHGREELDHEKGNLECRDSLGEISSSEQDFSKLCPREQCGTVNVLLHGEKSGKPLAFHFLSKSRDASNYLQAQMEEDCRISVKQSSHFPTCSGERRRTQETMGRVTSWLATFTFSVCLFSVTFSKPLLQPQGSHALWLSLIAVSNFAVFLSAASVMIVVGARFTQMQITTLLISFVASLLA
ncbi:hypothetical protein SESBI_02507 [Sesbania bispinosa]|nr:hypothetical protein SESBI_02507 [Sesbania bispinosa]